MAEATQVRILVTAAHSAGMAELKILLSFALRLPLLPDKIQGGADEHIAEDRRFSGSNPDGPDILSENSDFSSKAQITGDIR